MYVHNMFFLMFFWPGPQGTVLQTIFSATQFFKGLDFPRRSSLRVWFKAAYTDFAAIFDTLERNPRTGEGDEPANASY